MAPTHRHTPRIAHAFAARQRTAQGHAQLPHIDHLTCRDVCRRGVAQLSKSFLDPFGNEGYPGQNIRVDVLVSELNFGAASRWMKAGEARPVRE